MRWPEWTERFRHCCGLCEGPHNEHYDAWLARERLAQVKRLETKLADLSKDNAVLSTQLGQAVSVLDSYHSFDMDAIAAGGPQGPAGLQVENRSDSGRYSHKSGSRSQDLAPATSGSGRLSSLKPPSASSGRLSSANRISRKVLMSGIPSASGGLTMSRVGSLQPQAPPRQWQEKPKRRSAEEQRMSIDSNITLAPTATPPRARQATEIPTAEEFEALLARKSGRRTIGPRQPSPATPVKSQPVPQPSPVAARTSSPLVDLQRAASAQLPAVDSLISLPRQKQPFLPTLSEGSGSAKSAESFEFATTKAPQQLPTPVVMTPKIGIMQGPAVQPVPQANAVPVLDPKMMAHQARGQIYSGHYSAETSPFAKAAARMPKPPADS